MEVRDSAPQHAQGQGQQFFDHDSSIDAKAGMARIICQVTGSSATR
jgi:hypothetical protein